MVYTESIKESLVENIVNDDITILEAIDIDEHVFLLNESFKDFIDKGNALFNKFIEILKDLGKKLFILIRTGITKLEDLIRKNNKVKDFINKIDMSWTGTIRVKVYKNLPLVSKLPTVVLNNKESLPKLLGASLLMKTEKEISDICSSYEKTVKEKNEQLISEYDSTIEDLRSQFKDEDSYYITVRNLKDIKEVFNLSNISNIPTNQIKSYMETLKKEIDGTCKDIERYEKEINISIKDKIKNDIPEDMKKSYTDYLKRSSIISKTNLEVSRNNIKLYKKEFSVFEEILKSLLKISTTNTQAKIDIEKSFVSIGKYVIS